MYAAVKKFKHLVEGRNFIIFTDHKPLIFAFKQNLSKASPRQFRYLDFVSQFTTDIRHISGAENVVADALSRLDVIEMPESIDFIKIADAQRDDTELVELKKSVSDLIFIDVPLAFNSSKTICCDRSIGCARPFIPLEFRKQVFEAAHNLAHPGAAASVKLLTDQYVWPGIKRDVRRMVQSCIPCQKSKVTRHTVSPLGNFAPVSSRFSEIHLDIVGPLPPSENQRYCVTLIDRFTRWTEAVPVPDIRAETVARAVLSHWIARFGVPTSIVTDQGSQFESELFAEFAKTLGFERKRTTAYNPKCNGFVERWHRTLKAAIMCHAGEQWTQSLPLILLGLRTAFREDLQSSSAELVYGENIRVPSQLIEEKNVHTHQSDFAKELRGHFDRVRPAPPSRHANPKIFISPELNRCTHVFVRTDLCKRSLQPPYEGPFQVLKRQEKAFQISIKGKPCNISIDRLKPCYLLENQQESQQESSSASSSQSETPPVSLQNDGNVTHPAESTKTPHETMGSGECIRKVKFDLKEQTSVNGKPHYGNSGIKKPCLKQSKLTTTTIPSIPSSSSSTTRAGRQTKTPTRYITSLTRQVRWQGGVW